MRRFNRRPRLVTRPHGRLDHAGREQRSFEGIRRLFLAEEMLDGVRQGLEQVAVAPRAGVEARRPRPLLAGHLNREVPADAVAAEVIRRCTGQASFGEIIDELVKTYSAPREKILDDVTTLLSGLAEKKLLEL